ncbi:PREDICTED: perilipin-3-like [Tinamus guttatus]|uniref:perilipin-3-like n=1 Tax=Tinamus guttatus TaxID=94827 RepID=UPI00052F2E27|nr:PREDICTED: perilipin-3-like [Tinamus guttatus]
MVMQEAFSQLHEFIELIDCVKQGIDQNLQNGQEKLHQMWMMWNKSSQKESSIQDKMQQVQQELQKTHNSFSAAASFQDLTRNILTQKHYLMNTAQEYMDELLECVEHNIPLAWLVGPFTPSRASVESQDSAKEKEDEENKSHNIQSCGSQLV